MSPRADLTAGPVAGHIRRLAVPAATGFLFTTLYKLIDTVFAGMWSTAALAGLALSFPVFFLIISASVGFGQGSTALIANAIGARDPDRARLLTAQVFVFATIAGTIVAVTGIAAAPFVFDLLGAGTEDRALALEYIVPVMGAAPLFLLNSAANAPITAQGDTKPYRNALMAGAALNAVLDPLFMFTFGLGVAGIAWATVLIHGLTAAYLVHSLRRTPLAAGLTRSLFRPRLHVHREIAHQGLPASGNLLMVGCAIFTMTYFFGRHGSPAVAAYGIAIRIEQLVLLPTVGLNAAALALVGQNFGARDYDRVHEIYRRTLTWGVAIMTLGALAIVVARAQLLGIFTGDPAVITVGSAYLLVAAPTLPAFAIVLIGTSTLQGMKLPLYGLVVGIGRSLLGPPVVIWVMSVALSMGIAGIWWGIFVLNWTAALITFLYVRVRLARACPRTPAPAT